MRNSAFVVLVTLALGACTSGPVATSPAPGTSSTPSERASAASPNVPSRQPSATATTQAPASATASATSAAPTPSDAASLCEDKQSGEAGDRSVGTVSGQVTSGRVLIGIEAAAGPSGTFALAYIDSSGLHEIPSVADWTTAHATWETPTTVVFDSERAGDRHLFRADISDGSVTQITNAYRTGEQSADILGDGRLVHDQYSCSAMIDMGLNITTADGSATTDLTPAHSVNDPAYDSEAAVSPDGHTVVFVRHVDDNTAALFSIDASGGDVTRLMPDSDQVEYPRWSPDGKTILFDQTFLGAIDLWTIPGSGGTPKRLTQSDPGAQSWEADWSPDGKQVVFKYYQHGWNYNELHLANADGSNETTLWTGDASTAETPHWGP